MEQMQTICRKRGQLRRAVTDLVHLAMGWLDEAPLKGDKEKQLELIKVLDSITEGKVSCSVVDFDVVLIVSDHDRPSACFMSSLQFFL